MAVLTTEIYLDNLAYNYHILKNYTPHLAAVIKADAYGLGAEIVAQTLINSGCIDFFVANAYEGKLLRAQFPNINIYILDGFVDKQIIIQHNLRPVINSLQQLKDYGSLSKPLETFLHIDTGMNRLGVPENQISDITPALLTQAHISGVMSHFTASEEDDLQTQRQTQTIIEYAKNLNIKKISLANSYGILGHYNAFNETNINITGRAGIALYGGVDHAELKPVVSVKGKILQKNHVSAGTYIGYNGTYMTDKPTKLITVAGGYADGIMRSLSGTDYCGYLDGGYFLPLIGKVSMDTTIFDASQVSGKALENADELEFFGFHQSISKIAACAGTISYEFLTNLSRRAARLIKSN